MMLKKYYILALTFLCLFLGQVSYGLGNGDYYGDEDEKFCFDCVNPLKEVEITPEPKDEEPADTMDPCDPRSSAYDYCICHYPFCEETLPEDTLPDDDCPTGDYCECYGICPDETEPVKDPCDENQQNTVINQITSQYLAGRLSEVRASLQPPNTLIEKGFGIYKTTIGTDAPSPIKTGLSTTEPSVTIGFSTSDTNYIPSAMLHSHPSGVYANPSAGDIYGLAGLFTSINTVTTSYVLAADDTTYAMVVTDPTALANFVSTYPASANQSNDSFTTGSPTYNLYRAAYLSFTNSGLSDAVAEERANAVVMAEAGINLLKAPANSTDFKQIQGTKVIDSNGNATFTKSDCP